METVQKGLCSSLEEWLENHHKGKYKSSIKINGYPILPPLMTEERRIEMRCLREKAIEVETKLFIKRRNSIPDDTAGGEGLYEVASDELYFATSLPCSLTENVECQPHHNQALNPINTEVMKETDTCKVAQDMLREFDPLAPEQNLNLSRCTASSLNEEEAASEVTLRSHDTADSKPCSAESSTSLSDSTDLNNYMDVTECSIADNKSVDGTTTITSQLDSARLHTSSTQDGKTTYEDLINYLDVILNNSDDVSTNVELKNKMLQNVQKPWDILDQNEGQRSTETLKSECLHQDSNAQTSFSPEPLTEPLDSLQTRLFPDHMRSPTPSKDCMEPKDESSSFLYECSLSPVFQDHPQKQYEQKIYHHPAPQIAHQNNKDESLGTSSVVDEEPLKPKLSLDSYHNKPDGTDAILEAPPRLVRSNSYTLDSPSPLLLAHMEAELRKNCLVKTTNDKVKSTIQDRARSALCSGRARRVWDVEKAKHSSNWYNKRNCFPNNQLKRDSNARTSQKVQIHSNVCHASPVQSSETSSASTSSQTSSEPSSLQSSKKSEKAISQSVLGQHNVTASMQMPNTSLEAGNSENANLILAKLHLQHTREMEELLNRQKKEQETIRLVLLREQTSVATVVPSTSMQNPASELFEKDGKTHSTTHQKLHISDSPPSKDKALGIERRNTSPSIYQNRNSMELQRYLVQFNKSSSISVNDVSVESQTHEYDANSLDKIFSSYQSHSHSSSLPSNSSSPNISHQQNGHECALGGQITTCSSTESFSSFVAAGPSGVQLNGSTNSGFSSKMISSFPPSHLSHSLEIESMVASLPSSFEFVGNHPLQIAEPVQMSVTSDSLQEATSTRSKRKSWCSRQLFSDESGKMINHDSDWVQESQMLLQHAAAARIQAGVRGYLTRRLLKTERVQNCITTIRDTIVCALQLQKECAPHVEPSDLQLHGRLIQQLSAACEDLHNIFLGLPVSKRMSLISADREWLRTRSSRSSSATGSRPLSRATQIALQRKFNQTDPVEVSSVHSAVSSGHRTRRRSWASTRSSHTAPNICSVITGCLSRSSAPSGNILQRSASSGYSRQPWR